MASIKSNYVFNLLHSAVGLLFPLLTFPYASRIILAEGIGTIQFLQSIIDYVALFSALGIPLYAIREIARVRNDAEKTAETTVEILLLHIGLTGIGYIAVLCIAAFATDVAANMHLFLLLSISLILNALGCEWFYRGTENFRYIAIRGLIVRILSVIFLFLFVKDKDDICYYAVYTLCVTGGNNLLNFIHLRKFVRLGRANGRKIDPLRHLRPALHVFALNVIISVYVNLDTVMLGFMSGPAAVGYYTAAAKLSRISLTIVNAIGLVLLSRMSALHREGETDEFNRLAQKSMDLTVGINTPLCLGMIVMAPTLIRLLCGPSYEPSVTTLAILAPVLPIIGISNVMGIQILYPQGKENLVMMATAAGAVVNVLLNLLLIGSFAQNGAAAASVAAELCVTATMAVVARRYLPFDWRAKSSRYAVCLLGAAIMFFICLSIRRLPLGDILSLMTVSAAGITVYGSVLLLFKDPLALEIKRAVMEKLTFKL